MRKITQITSLILIVTFSACSSTTLIETVPPGAKLYLNGDYVGDTPYHHTDKKIFGANTIMEMKLDGYAPRRVILKKDEEPNIGAIIGGLFCLFPWLWIMGYKPIHTYELKRGGGQALPYRAAP